MQLVCLVIAGRLGIKAIQDRRVPKDRSDQLAKPVFKVLKATVVLKESADLKGIRAPRVILVLPDLVVRLDLLDQLASKVLQGLKEIKVSRDLLVPKAIRETLDHKVTQGR